MNPSTIRVGIVDDEQALRDSLGDYLSDQVGFVVVGEAACGSDALRMAAGTSMHVLVVDLGLSGAAAVDALCELRAHAPGVALLVLSKVHADEHAAALIRNGASAYLDKNAERGEIVAALRMLAMGRRCIPPGVARLLSARAG